MARLAITKDVLSAFAKLDKRVQGAVEGAIAGFANGHQAEAHLEKVPGSLDDRIRLLRLDGAWFGAVLVPDRGDTYCLLTILPLNEAVSYATSHRIGVNQATGVLEVSNSAAIQEMKPSLETAAKPNVIRLFADVSDAELTRLGIDAQVRPLVRLLVNDTDLDALQAILPEAQYTALHALASGMTVDEALAETVPVLSGATPSGQVHGDDLVAAMERTPDQVAFVSGQEELQLILAHPFAAWRTFLHPSQREISYRPSYSGPAQVTGGPGTGKTVTLLHRAAFLAARAASAPEPTGPGAAGASGPDPAPILLTTFNGNLADALQAQADLLIRDLVVRHQIQVRNVDRLAYSIVKEARGTPVIADERVLRARWTEAAAAFGLDLTPAFLKNEWEQVILAQDLRNEQAYLTCLRTGRGRPLTKAQRSLVWQAAQQVTAELAAARQSTHLQLANEATHLLREAGAPRHRHILVDEAQDLHPAQWRLLRAAVAEGPDDLFIAADPHQRIYNNRVSLASLRISVRGRSRKLSLNYRTTQEILAWAMPLLGSDPVTGLDGEIDALIGYRSAMHGQRPQLRLAATRAEEFAFLSERIRSWLAAGLEPGAIGITARSARLVREAREALKAEDIETTSVSGRGSSAGVRACTMHAMKGLEFQAVAVIGVEEGVVPDPAALTADDEDPLAHAQDLQRERCVLFVACTRARDHLYLSGTGSLSAFLSTNQANALASFIAHLVQARPSEPGLGADQKSPDHGVVAQLSSGAPESDADPGPRSFEGSHMMAAADPLRVMLLRQLTQNLPSNALVLCTDGGDRPELIVVDSTYGLVVVDIDTTGCHPTAREPFSRLNRKVIDLRLEVPVVERFRPHRLVLFGDCSDALIPGPQVGLPRALGLADIERGDWLERLEPRPPKPADLDELRSALAPTLVFRVRSRRGVSDPGRSDRRRRQVELDAQQAAAATIPVDDVLMLSGPAGSGKTLVLAARAKYLAARHPDWRIVLLCYNNALVPYLRQLVNGYPNVAVTTFGKFSHAMGYKISFDGGELAAADLAAAKARGIRPVVDALLIDEAQDFDDAWVSFALETVRAGRGGTILSGDARQALYRRGAGQPLSLPGRRVTHLRLERSYRSTRQILEAASTTLPHGGPSVYREALEGQPVELVWASTWDEQAKAAAWEIRRMIDRGEREPRDIAVIITQWHGTLRRLRTALEGVSVPHLVVEKKNAATFDPQSPEVKIMTVHAAKGYEFDVVVLFGLEALPSPAGGDQSHGQLEPDRGSVGFVGMTRARDQLLVTYTRDTPYLDRLRRCSGISSSTWPDDYEV